MKKIFFGIVLLLCFGLVYTSYISAEAGKKKKAQGTHVEASGIALWNHMKGVDYSKKWQMWPGKTAFYQGTEPHGVLLTTYVNGPALKAIKTKKGVLPNGAIIAKENYSSEKKLMAITVMYKVAGFNPEARDWFWVKYLPDGKIEAEGKVKMCIECHAKAKRNDYVTTEPLK
jgi:hypothetical protein